MQVCPPIYTTVLVILAFVLGFGGYLLKKIRDKRKGKAPKLQSVFFKVHLVSKHRGMLSICSRVFVQICVSSFQQIAIASSTSFMWSEAMTDFLSVQSDVTSLGVAYLEFSCLDSSMGNSFVTETVVYILLPLVLILGVFLGAWGHAKFISPGQAGEGTAWSRASSSSVGVATLLLYFLQVLLQIACYEVYGRAPCFSRPLSSDLRCSFHGPTSALRCRFKIDLEFQDVCAV